MSQTNFNLSPAKEIDRPSRRIIAYILPIVLTAVCLWMASPDAAGPRREGLQPANSTAAVAASATPDAIPVSLPADSPKLITRPIETIRPGMRVLADNPENSGRDVNVLEISDTSDWRLVTYQMPKPDGSDLFVEMLRPTGELEGRRIGAFSRLSFPELAIEGDAEITAVNPCPAIESGSGYLVTAKFTHTAANVINLHVASESEQIGTTSNHPFWSEDRQDWVQAGDLQPGERLRLVTGTLTHVISVAIDETTQPVYNLTVDAQHTYYVGASGVLVHNSQNYNSAIGKALEWLTAHGFNSTRATPYASRSSVKFMDGRMNGMRDGNIGYRIEYHSPHNAHINVFAGRTQGPHFEFSGSEADVSAILRQLFGN